mgnify:CR=1 FL=1
MRCVNCGAFSLRTICAACAANLAECRLGMRQVEGFSVFYYYGYSEIRELILSKHHEYGAAVLARIASLSLAKFPFHLQREISANPQNYEAFKTTDGIFKFNAVPLDDDARSGYSHTAILARALKSKLIEPKFHCLRAQNRVKYTGQSLEFRLKHKRNFKILTKYVEGLEQKDKIKEILLSIDKDSAIKGTLSQLQIEKYEETKASDYPNLISED